MAIWATAILLPSLPATFTQEEREPWSEEQFFEWCQANGNLRVERHGFSGDCAHESERQRNQRHKLPHPCTAR